MSDGLGQAAGALFFVGILLGGVLGGVLGTFTDVEVSDHNTLRAGSLDLKLDGGENVTTFIFRGMMPCPADRTCRIFEDATRLSNVGKNRGNLTIAIRDDDVFNHPGITFESEREPDRGELGNLANLTLFLDLLGDGFTPGVDTALTPFEVSEVATLCPAGEGSGCLVKGERAPADDCLFIPKAAALIFEPVNEWRDCRWQSVLVLEPDRLNLPEFASAAVLEGLTKVQAQSLHDDMTFVTVRFTLTQIVRQLEVKDPCEGVEDGTDGGVRC